MALGGGIRTGMVTELVGESTAAKSQLCLQLLQTVQLPLEQGGLAGSALYIYTEGEPPLRRLQAMAEHRKSHGVGLGAAALHNVFVEKGTTTPQDLLTTLAQARSLFANPPSRPVKLIVIDSVANIFRDLSDSPGADELAQRADYLFKMSKMLKSYADEYGLAAVVVNQVTDVIANDGARAPRMQHLVSSGRQVAPALGMAWSHCINTRIFASREGGLGPGGALVRKLQVIFSPYLPPCHCYFEVHEGGVRGVLPPQPLQSAWAPGAPRLPPEPQAAPCASSVAAATDGGWS